MRQDWTLVLEDPSKANQRKFEQGDFRSVSGIEAIERLKDQGFDIGDDDIARIRAVARIRNRLQHFGLTESVNAVEAVAANALDFVRDFINTYIYVDSDENDREILDGAMPSIQQGYGKIRHLVEVAMNRIEPALDAAEGPVVTCATCGELALIVEDQDRTCKFCGASWPNGEGAASDYAWHVLGLSEYEAVKDGGDMPTRECPDCWADALVSGVAVRGHADEMWVCFACGEVREARELTECTRCGQLMHDDEMTICADCMADIVSRD